MQKNPSFLFILAALWNVTPLMAADLLLLNGKVITMDPAQPQAEAIAILKDKILAVGSTKVIQKLQNSGTHVIDLKGALVLPGFIDSHAHVLGLGQFKRRIDLIGTKGIDEIVNRIKTEIPKFSKGEWIQGRGWDQNDWEKMDFPTHEPLTKISTSNPIFLSRVDGHAAWVNREAMRIAGIDRTTKDPDGGRIIRDKDGEPTGVFIDNAVDLIRNKIPPPKVDQKRKAILAAADEALRYGVTSIHDAGVGEEEIAIYKDLAKNRKLPIRVYAMLDGSDAKLVARYLDSGPEIGLGNGHLTIRSVKVYGDGALGSRGAALLTDYKDEPGNRGLLQLKEEQITAMANQALKHGFQFCTHAIGDAANQEVLNAYEKAFQLNPDRKDPRFRIEHAQILAGSDIPRFQKLGVIAAMQATHATSDMPWVHDRIGADRAAEGAYVWRSLLDSGAIVTGGSDAPVETINPLWGIYSAVTRQDQTGKPAGGWYPKQRMTMEEAVRSFTRNAAFAAFEEDQKGTISVGKLADLVVLDHDLFSIKPAEILETRVMMTIVGGKVIESLRATR